MLSAAEVKRLSMLARLEVRPEDGDRLARELDRILGFVRQLEAAPAGEIEPLVHPLDLAQPLRDDEVREQVDCETIERGAPDVAEGYYRVPRVIE
jgi:aspartyl-tRNA(Asn)/glutamyl-tRNA(Gln) amidotransferase subunit C